MQHGFAKLSKGPDTFAAILRALAVPAVSRGVRTPILVADATANSRWISSASPSLTSTLHWFETEVQCPLSAIASARMRCACSLHPPLAENYLTRPLFRQIVARIACTA
jgi:hypothetical protein